MLGRRKAGWNGRRREKFLNIPKPQFSHLPKEDNHGTFFPKDCFEDLCDNTRKMLRIVPGME